MYGKWFYWCKYVRDFDDEPNVLKATVPDRMVWLPKTACVIAAVRLSKAVKDAHPKETSNLLVRAARF